MAVTKVDIWNAFRVRRGYREIPEPEAKALMSPASIRYWTKQGWLHWYHGEVTNITLTDEGKQNLETGIISYIRKHPDVRPEVQHLPKRLAKALK